MSHQRARPMPHLPPPRSGHQSPRQRTARLTPFHPVIGRQLRTDSARPIRFAITGALAGLVQLALLSTLVGKGWSPVAANATAFLLAAQLNFALSSVFTWRDR